MKDKTSTDNPSPTLQNLCQQERARRVVEDNKISFDMKLHTFTVMEPTCSNVVTLFPKESCSCPSTTQLAHYGCKGGIWSKS